ncbi:DNA/RNA non-specific endonuclease [Teredinibacter turnerae]|uniref:DNA/RNA non-specific endonuclease n=1 Tax=Teredinibacter turnerae TaxID=2426 RepID=UPI0003F7B206|nr:DNA/RNA non-specific endonuclease [Teredinibacter turnerae]
MKMLIHFAFIAVITGNTLAQGLSDCTLNPAQKQDSINEHIWGGRPDASKIYPRRAYVLAYNDKYLVPRWTAWHAMKSYRDTPERKTRWSSFRRDPELKTVTDNDYVGWYGADENFARGHLTPFFISGGDRDHDGKDAEYEDSLAIEDIDDACTVFEINAMTNIAPQYHKAFNGQPGIWWKLETDVRNMIDDGREFHIIAGTVFLEGKAVQKIGDREKTKRSWKIGVPHGYFKIVIDTQSTTAIGFLFDHSDDLQKGCSLVGRGASWPSECIVEIADIESVTGLKFFRDVSSADYQKLHGSKEDARATWLAWVN